MNSNRYFHGILFMLIGALIGFYGLFLSRFLGNNGLFWTMFIPFLALSHFLFGLYTHRLHKGTNTDTLTKLWNRRYCYAKLEIELKKLVRCTTTLSLAMIDIDNFKQINDIHGHLEGDRILIGLTHILNLNIRSKDIVARWGGEEFILIMPNTTQDEAFLICEQIRQSVEDYGNHIGITISAGTTSITKPMNPDALIELADTALYKAKETKNAVAHV